MPLLQRPNHTSWQALVPAYTDQRPTLARGYAGELPDDATLRANLPRLPSAPGTLPTHGRPTRPQLGLGAAPTGNPANAGGRSSVLMSGSY